MAHQDIIREFEIHPAVTVPGEKVTLRAVLAIPFSELERKQAFRFTGPDSQTVVIAHTEVAANVAEATWDAKIGAPIQEYEFFAQIFEERKSIESESRSVTIVSRAGLSITSVTPDPVMEGDAATVAVSYERFDLEDFDDANLAVAFLVDGRPVRLQRKSAAEYVLDSTGFAAKTHNLTALLVDRDGRPIAIRDQEIRDSADLRVAGRPLTRTDTLRVSLQRSSAVATRDQALWALIRDRTLALSFSDRSFTRFIDAVLGLDPTAGSYPQVAPLTDRARRMRTHAFGMDAYELLKDSAEAFLAINCGTAPAQAFTDGFDPDDEVARGHEIGSAGELRDRLTNYFGSAKRLPYLDRIVRAVFPDGDAGAATFFRPNALSARANAPCLLELIWSYWHEEGMLVQTMNAISRRFQNVRAPGDRDPLAHLEIDPLRPLNNILWGYIQDETNLLTVKRRAYEYDHHYGLTLYGKAVPTLRPADSRSKFLEAFHNLLHMTAVFYKEDNDTTVIADGFPLLNALREVHLLLAQGAHNQFGDLPWTARAEMLMQQWILARPEMREFLQSRPMVPYKEAWMSQVDTMKTLQGWSDVTVTHFRDLGVYGEQILLTIRYGDWIDVNDENAAKNWARYWRPEIQGYLHAYRAVTGVDLTNPEGVDYTMPAVHLQKRLAAQRTR